VQEKMKSSEEILHYFKTESIEPTEINPSLEALGSRPITQKVKMFGVLSRPDVTILDFALDNERFREFVKQFDEETLLQAEILMKYEGYIVKEHEVAQKLQRLENITLGDEINYRELTSLSNEAREKLSKIKPSTIGQAARISGISPSDISILMVYLGR
jgi:tRNA uridine 5-carboxymethylaminomethyl modification enzyme